MGRTQNDHLLPTKLDRCFCFVSDLSVIYSLQLQIRRENENDLFITCFSANIFFSPIGNRFIFVDNHFSNYETINLHGSTAHTNCSRYVT